MRTSSMPVIVTDLGAHPEFVLPVIEFVQPEPIHFPERKSTNLLNIDVNLPQDFEGAQNVVFVTFERNQQRHVDARLSFMVELEDRFPGLLTYEVPVIQHMNDLAELFVRQGMRLDIDGFDERTRTIPLFANKEMFKRQLGIPSADNIHILLLDDTGQVLWRTSGPMSPQTVQQLLQEIIYQNR